MSSLSAISSATALQQSQALGTSTTSGAPVVDEANLPAAIRNGTTAQKKDYQTALSFESVLVGQMTKSMMATTGMPGMDGASSADSSSGGDDASQQMLKQTLPDTLASAIMNNGGLGLAQQLDSTYPTTTTSLAAAAKAGGVSTTPATTAGAASTDGTSTTTTDASADAGQGGVTA